jgi:hypothetical protein
MSRGADPIATVATTALMFTPLAVFTPVVGAALSLLNSGETEGRIHAEENTKRDYYRQLRWQGMLKVLAVKATESWYKFFKLAGRGAPLNDAQEQAFKDSINVFDDFVVTPHYGHTFEQIVPEGNESGIKKWLYAVSKIPREGINGFPSNQSWNEFLSKADDSIKSIERILHEFYVIRILQQYFPDTGPSGPQGQILWGSAEYAQNYPLEAPPDDFGMTIWQAQSAILMSRVPGFFSQPNTQQNQNYYYYWGRPTLEKFDETLRLVYAGNSSDPLAWTGGPQGNALKIIEMEEDLIRQEAEQAAAQQEHDREIIEAASGEAARDQAQVNEELLAAMILLTEPQQQIQASRIQAPLSQEGYGNYIIPAAIIGIVALSIFLLSGRE